MFITRLAVKGKMKLKSEFYFQTYNLFSFLHNVLSTWQSQILFTNSYILIKSTFQTLYFWHLNYHILFSRSKHSPLLSISKTCLPPEFKILHPLHLNYFPAFSLSLSFCINQSTSLLPLHLNKHP